MIKVSVLYPNGADRNFNMDYYLNTHVPMVVGLLGDALKGATIEKGLSGAEPGSPSAYLVMGNMYFDTMESFGAAFGANAQQIMGDAPNFYNGEPVVQISEVLV